MDSNISTVAYQSNLQPVADSFLFDSKFHEKVHDPFALKILKSNVQLTRLQDNEYSHSIHCSFADPKDYPWGTIINAQKKNRWSAAALTQPAGTFQVAVQTLTPRS